MLSMSIDTFPATRLFLAVLLHFVWQATIIAAVMAAGRGLIHPRFFRARYALLVSGLVLVLLAPLVTIGYYVTSPAALQSLHPSEPVVGAGAGAAATVAVASTTEWLESQFLSVFRWFDTYRSAWLGAWLIGFVLLMARLCVSLQHCIRIRRSRVPLPPHLERIAEQLKQKLKITRDVVVASSQEVTQAIATGVFKPVVLVPASWITQMPIASIEAVLAHELAHIKRWDLWINWLQRFTETVFFFHPLVWWLSRQISNEREVCCDQLAIELTGQPLRYVETLAQVAGKTTCTDFEFQFGTAFVGGKNMNLLRRSKMILEPSSVDARSPVRTLTLLACFGLLATCCSYAYCTTPDPGIGLMQEEQEEEPKVRKVIVRKSGDGADQQIIEWVEQEDAEEDDARKKLHVHLKKLLHQEGDHADHSELAAQLRKLADQLEASDKKKKSNNKVRHRRYQLRTKEHEEAAKKRQRVRLVERMPGDVEVLGFEEAGDRVRAIVELEPPHEEAKLDPRQSELIEVIELEPGAYDVRRLRGNVEARVKLDPEANIEHEVIELRDREADVRRLHEIEFTDRVRQNIELEIHPEIKTRQNIELEVRPEIKTRRNLRFNVEPKVRERRHIVADVLVQDPEGNERVHEMHFEGNGHTSSDELGDVIRELKREVQMLRKEVDQLRHRDAPRPKRRRTKKKDQASHIWVESNDNRVVADEAVDLWVEASNVDDRTVDLLVTADEAGDRAVDLWVAADEAKVVEDVKGNVDVWVTADEAKLVEDAKGQVDVWVKSDEAKVKDNAEKTETDEPKRKKKKSSGK